jgi:NitT/TauT family transport system permease protein
MRKQTKFKRAAITIAALLFWGLIWHFIAEKVGISFILPKPVEVIRRFGSLLITKEFYIVLFTSFGRIFLGYFGGLLLGVVLGTLAYHSPIVRSLISPLMSIVRATPVASFIILVLLWVNTDLVPSLISLLMVLPIIWQNTILGWEGRDRNLSEMAKVFRLGRKKVFFAIDLPQITPSVTAAAKTALGLAWKAGVAAEVLALPKISVGTMINDAKIYYTTPDLYAWTGAIIIFSILLEKLLSLVFTKKKGENHENQLPL